MAEATSEELAAARAEKIIKYVNGSARRQDQFYKGIKDMLVEQDQPDSPEMRSTMISIAAKLLAISEVASGGGDPKKIQYTPDRQIVDTMIDVLKAHVRGAGSGGPNRH